MNENEIGEVVVDCAVRMHMELGPDQAALAGILKPLYELHLPVVKTECEDSEDV